jgi:hypothetical protein
MARRYGRDETGLEKLERNSRSVKNTAKSGADTVEQIGRVFGLPDFFSGTVGTRNRRQTSGDKVQTERNEIALEDLRNGGNGRPFSRGGQRGNDRGGRDNRIVLRRDDDDGYDDRDDDRGGNGGGGGRDTFLYTSTIVDGLHNAGFQLKDIKALAQYLEEYTKGDTGIIDQKGRINQRRFHNELRLLASDTQDKQILRRLNAGDGQTWQDFALEIVAAVEENRDVGRRSTIAVEPNERGRGQGRDRDVVVPTEEEEIVPGGLRDGRRATVVPAEQGPSGATTAPAAAVAAPPALQPIAADPALEAKLNSLIASLSLSADQKQKISNQVTAAIEAHGYKVEGDPVGEFSGLLTRLYPTKAKEILTGTPLEAGLALQDVLKEIQASANEKLAARQQQQGGVAATPTPAAGSPTATSVSNPRMTLGQDEFKQFIEKKYKPMVDGTSPSGQAQAQVQPQASQAREVITEQELAAAIQRGGADTLNKVSDLKRSMNKLYGTEFKDNDEVSEKGFLSDLTKSMNENLDPKTIAALRNGSLSEVQDTMTKLADNMNKRGEMEKHRDKFDAALDNGATDHIVSSVLSNGDKAGKRSYTQLQQDLRKLGFDDKDGLPASLQSYLAQKIEQPNYGTVPKEVQDFLLAVEKGKFDGTNPLHDGRNARQVEAVQKYLNEQVSLDLAAQERSPSVRTAAVGTAAGQAAAGYTPMANATSGAAATPPQGQKELAYYRTLATSVLPEHMWGAMDESSKKWRHLRDLNDIANAIVWHGPKDPFVEFHAVT